jgi:alanine racemase
VIKGNAYGRHTIILPLGEEAGIDHILGVLSPGSPRGFSGKKPETRIMIMGHIGDEELEWAVENGLEFFVFDMERLKQAILLAEKTGQKATSILKPKRDSTAQALNMSTCPS